MTAIVGILNKRAAVMAADSAVTVNNDKGVKIYNTETKIFRLSDEHPIGVMIYDNVEFMGTPWELIFNLYRKERGNMACHSVQEYAEMFIGFLKDNDFFSSDESRETYLLQEIPAFYNLVKNEVSELMEKEGFSIDDSQAIREKVKDVIDEIIGICKETEICPDFENYSEKEFSKTSKLYIDSLMEACGDDHLPTDMRKEWQHAIFMHLCSNNFIDNLGTGVVFIGYGDQDIFPSVFPTVIGGAIDNRLRYFFNLERADKITHENSACILPFAQGDVMITMMKGIAPDMYTAITEEVRQLTEKAVRQVAEKLGVSDDEKVTEAAAPVIEMTQKELEEKIDDIIMEKFTSGLVNTVEFFNVEDMVNMAESLISITNLQRHITSSEETVGGPIDVAVITKTDGFKWVKQKTTK